MTVGMPKPIPVPSAILSDVEIPELELVPPRVPPPLTHVVPPLSLPPFVALLVFPQLKITVDPGVLSGVDEVVVADRRVDPAIVADGSIDPTVVDVELAERLVSRSTF